MIERKMLDQMSIEMKSKEWNRQQKTLSQVKEDEMQLRRIVCKHILVDKIKGAKTQLIGNLKLVATAVLNKKIEDEVELEAIYQDLTPEEQDCIKYKPTIVESKLKLLPDDSILHSLISEAPGTPSLKVKAELDLEESPLKNL